MKVYPAPGLRVRDPVTKAHIPQTGHEVPDGDLFWARRVRDGDVVLTKPNNPVENVATPSGMAVNATLTSADAGAATHKEGDKS